MPTLNAIFNTTTRWFEFWAGNGHTIDTDPTRKGWKVKQVRGRKDQLVIMGRVVDGKQLAGCASILPLSDGRLDVAIYEDLTPKEVLDTWANGDYIDCPYFQIKDVSGWGLAVISRIEADLAWLAKRGE